MQILKEYVSFSGKKFIAGVVLGLLILGVDLYMGFSLRGGIVLALLALCAGGYKYPCQKDESKIS